MNRPTRRSGAADPPGLARRPAPPMIDAGQFAPLSEADAALPPLQYPTMADPSSHKQGTLLSLIAGALLGGGRGAAAAGTGYLQGAMSADQQRFQRDLGQFQADRQAQQDEFTRRVKMADLALKEGGLEVQRGGLDLRRDDSIFNRGMAQRRQDYTETSGNRRLGLMERGQDFTESDSNRKFSRLVGRDAVADRQFDQKLMQGNYDAFFDIYTAPAGSGVTPGARSQAKAALREIAPRLGIQFNAAPDGQPDPFLATPDMKPVDAARLKMQQSEAAARQVYQRGMLGVAQKNAGTAAGRLGLSRSEFEDRKANRGNEKGAAAYQRRLDAAAAGKEGQAIESQIGDLTEAIAAGTAKLKTMTDDKGNPTKSGGFFGLGGFDNSAEANELKQALARAGAKLQSLRARQSQVLQQQYK